MKHTLFSFFFLIAALLIIPFSHYGTHSRWTLLYGLLLFLGWLTSILLGQTFKTLPFIVWNEHYKKLTGRGSVPLPSDLYNAKLLHYQFYLYLPAMISLVTGMLLNMPVVIKSALVLWILLAVLYLTNVLNVLFHKPHLTDDHTA